MWNLRTNNRLNHKNNWATLALLAAAAGLPTIARAQLAYIFDSSGAHPAAPVDGNGNWDTTTSDWSNGAADVAWPNDNSIAVFGNGGTAGTVTIQTAVNAGLLVFNPISSGTYTIASGGAGDNLTLIGTPGIDLNANGNISAPIASSLGLTIYGTGMLNLSGVNTYTGATTVNGGTLQLGAAGTLPAATTLIINSGGTFDVNGQLQTVTSLTGSGSLLVGSGSNLTLNQAAATTFTGALSGSGTITKLLAGSVTLNTPDPLFTGTFALTSTTNNGLILTGNANINNGSIAVTNTTGTPPAGGPVIALNNLTPALTAPISFTATTGGDYRMSINATAGSTNAMSSNINIAFPTTATSGFPSFTMSDAGGSFAISSAITVNSASADGQIVFRGAGITNFSGSIHAPSGVIIATTDAGTLNFAPQAGSAWGTTGIGGTYTVSISSDAAIAGSASVAGGSNGLVFGGGTLQFKNYNSNLNFIQANMSSTTAALGLGTAAGTSTYTGSINLTGTNGLNLAGPGTLILNPSSPYSYGGATSVNSGTIQVDSSNIFPATSALTVATGAMLNLQDNSLTVKSLAGGGSVLFGPDSLLEVAAGATTTFSGNISGGGSFEVNGGILTLSGNNTYAGTTSINGTVILASATALPSTNDVGNYGTLNIGAFNTSLGSLYGFGTITGSGNLTVGSDNNNQIFGGEINTSGSLTLVGSSTFGMAGNPSDYSGPTNINSGTLQLQAPNPLTATTTLNIASIGTFDLNGFQQQVGAVIGTGSVLLSSNGQLTVGGAGINSTFSGSISGNGTLVIAEGTNAFTLAGSSTYTGGTQLVSGALAIASDAPVANILSGFSYNGGSLRFLNYTSNLSFNNVSNLTLGAATGAASTLAGSITGSTNLNYAGPGTLTLSSSGNNYSGGTTISGGNLQFAAGAFPTGTAITINAGGALNITGAFSSVSAALPSINTASTGSVALTGSSSENINFTGFGSLAFGAAVNSTYTGTITPGSNTYNLGGGGAALTLPNTNAITGGNNLVIGSAGSAGSVVLSGSNNFAGTTTLNGGVLAITSDAAINGGTGGITFAGGTLQFNNYASNLPAFNNDSTLLLGAASGTASTLNSAITGSSALTYAGPGTLILGSTGNNYSGPTIVNAGTVAIGAVGALPAATVLTVNAAGTLDLNGHSQTVASVNGTGNIITETGATLTIGAVGATTLTANISGPGGLTRNNSGTLSITSPLGLTGPVNIMQAVTTGATSITLSGNGSINSASSLNLSYTGTTVTGGTNIPTLILSNAATPVTVPITITLPTATGDFRSSITNAAGSNTISSPITLTAGNSSATVNLVSTTGPITVSSAFTDNNVAGAQLVLRGAATNTTLVGIFNGSIGGSGAASLTVAKTDPDTWLWEPTGSLSWGSTSIGVGVLKMGETNALPTAIALTIGGTGTAGATMDMNGFNQAITGLSLVSTTPTTNPILVTNTSATPATLTINTGTGTFTYGQTDTTIGGNLALTITGSGTQTINTGTQANTYTGGTTLTSGTLAFNALASLGTGPVIFNGGTLQYSGSANTADVSTNGVTINSAGGIINTNGASPTYANALITGGPLTKTGAGTLSLAAAQTFNSLTAAGGILRLAASGNIINGTVTINTSGTFETDGNTTATQLHGDGTGTLKIVAGTLKPTAQALTTVNLAALSIFPSASLDLTNGNLAINYGAGVDPLAATVAYLKNGYNHGNWNGTSPIDGSIISSTAAANHATTLGYADNTTLHQVQVKYTWYGDLNLDGVVNNADLMAMGTGTANTWATGDLNYDGVVNADDFALLMYGNASQNGSIPAGVPEPSGALLALALPALGLRRRARRA